MPANGGRDERTPTLYSQGRFFRNHVHLRESGGSCSEPSTHEPHDDSGPQENRLWLEHVHDLEKTPRDELVMGGGFVHFAAVPMHESQPARSRPFGAGITQI